MPERVIVVGSAGFIGKGLMRELQRAGMEACGFSRKDCDLLKRDEVLQIIAPELENATLVYAAGKHRQYGDTLELYEDNNTAVINMLLAAEKKPPGKIVFLSSLEVFGTIEKGMRVTVDLELSPTSLYAAGKIAQEYLIRTWARRHDLACTSLRLPGVYGVDDNQTSIVSTLFAKGMSGHTFDLHTDGNELRDYISSAELASCIVGLISQNSVPEVLNIGSGVSVSINHLVELIGQELGKPINVHLRSPPAAGFDIVIDDALLRNTLDDWPFSSIEHGIELYADLLKKVQIFPKG
jgi:UDP-glucose 4-epimerase